MSPYRGSSEISKKGSELGWEVRVVSGRFSCGFEVLCGVNVANRGFRPGRVWFSTPFEHNRNLNWLVFLQKLSNWQLDHIQPVVISRGTVVTGQNWSKPNSGCHQCVRYL
jgi:hypothetical protein